MGKIIGAALLLAIVLVAQAHGTPTQRSVRAHIQHVQHQIDEVKKHHQLTLAEQQSMQQQQAQAEQEIGGLVRQLADLGSHAHALEQQITALRAQHDALLKDYAKQSQALMQDDRLIWQAGRHDYFQMLLNQQQPSKLARMLHDFRVLAEDRTRQLDQLRVTVADMQATQQRYESQWNALQPLQLSLIARRQALAHARSQRQVAINALRGQVMTDDQRLARLQSNEAALGQVLQQLMSHPVVVGPSPVPPPSSAPKVVPAMPIGAVHTDCPLPVAGEVRNHFKAPRVGGLQWNGVVIAMGAGMPVHAVAAGQVVYAGYVRGFGWLIILDHGHGLMSLYGQNRSLLEKVGTSIKATQVIAESGDTGDASLPGVYFEMRRQGRPIDPLNWCH